MCGIVSIFAYHEAAPQVDRLELLRMRERMANRGPDGAGEWYSRDNRVGLGHRRLAIIDLSENGAQPMRSHDSGHVITFNGEIYNYRELRAGLEKKGYRFRTASDTEVLLALYAHKGQDMVHELRGMYAFAIWDEQKKGMFLARDPFGIKPLYYADDGRTFRAASQVKALRAGGGVDLSPEPAGHVGFFLWGHVPEPYTMHKHIRSLPAGAALWVDANGSGKPNIFCNISNELAAASTASPKMMTGEEVRARLREALLDSVRHHLIADVPIGVFLSAGLDSAILASLVAELAPRKLHTVTLGFQEYVGSANDEVPFAEQVAARLGSQHRTLWVRRSDFQEALPSIFDAMDQPSIDGVNSYFISRAAAEAGLKVALSGLGGDELFGSYPSFHQVPRLVRLCSRLTGWPKLGTGFRVATSPFMKFITSPKYAGLLEYGGSYGGAYLLRRTMYMPWELTDVLDANIVQKGLIELQTVDRLNQTVEGVTTAHHRVAALEMSWYMRCQLLRDTDWASMNHSLEVRVPFLDLALLRKTAPLLGMQASPDKRAVAMAVGNIPSVVLDRRKTGFVVPVREWILGDTRNSGERGLRGWAQTVNENR